MAKFKKGDIVVFSNKYWSAYNVNRDKEYQVEVLDVDPHKDTFSGRVIEDRGYPNAQFKKGEIGNNFTADHYNLVVPFVDPFEDLFKSLDKLEEGYGKVREG